MFVTTDTKNLTAYIGQTQVEFHPAPCGRTSLYANTRTPEGGLIITLAATASAFHVEVDEPILAMNDDGIEQLDLGTVDNILRVVRS
jgi:hypothetical protein